MLHEGESLRFGASVVIERGRLELKCHVVEIEPFPTRHLAFQMACGVRESRCGDGRIGAADWAVENSRAVCHA